MSYTKKEFIISALSELGLGESVFDFQDGDLSYALERLDAMILQWTSNGIAISYPAASSPGDSSLATDSNVPSKYNEAVITNLAIKIGPSFKIAISRETKVAANKSYNILLRDAANSKLVTKQYPKELPIGAGNKPWRNNNNPFYQNPDDPLYTNTSGDLDLN